MYELFNQKATQSICLKKTLKKHGPNVVIIKLRWKLYEKYYVVSFHFNTTCITKPLWHFWTIWSNIIFYLTTSLPSNTHFPKPNPTLLKSLSKLLSVKNRFIQKPFNWSVKRIHWLVFIWYQILKKDILEQVIIHLIKSLLLFLLFDTKSPHSRLVVFL